MTPLRLAAAAVLALIAAAPVAPAAEESPPAPAKAGPQVLGDPAAPVTIIEYASLSCPHCAAFHAERLPWLKTNYIETGRVKLEFRDFPLNAPALWGAMLAHCAGPDRYFAYLDLLFRRQRSWAFGEDPVGELKRLAQSAGMGAAAFDACMADEALQLAVIQARQDAVDTHNVQSTPTFIIGDDMSSGVPSEEELTKRIEAAGG